MIILWVIKDIKNWYMYLLKVNTSCYVFSCDYWIFLLNITCYIHFEDNYLTEFEQQENGFEQRENQGDRPDSPLMVSKEYQLKSPNNSEELEVLNESDSSVPGRHIKESDVVVILVKFHRNGYKLWR